LLELGFTRHVNRKTKEGRDHPDRDEQFEYINAQVSAFQAAGQPVISVDTKKKVRCRGAERVRYELKTVSYSCVDDDGRPIGIGFQERVSNQPEPLRPKDLVVSVG